MDKTDKDDSLFKNHLQAQNKLEYVQGCKKPDVECILCEVIKNSPKVERLTVYQDDLIAISLNLYPYNPAHLMIFPIRHITDFREFTNDEILRIMDLVKKCENMITEMYNPQGFNLGLNQGITAGASIAHLHFHLVPRFRNELGYIDIIGKTRVVVEGVQSVLEKMKKLVPKYFSSSS
jgi:ATP adenylyltransferase